LRAGAANADVPLDAEALNAGDEKLLKAFDAFITHNHLMPSSPKSV
jgi:hypothetical protein